MNFADKKEMMEQVKNRLMDIRELMQAFGGEYLSIAISDDRVSIILYDKDINHMLANSMWISEENEEWREIYPDGWSDRYSGGMKA